MTKDEAQILAPMIQALAEGKVIQMRAKGSDYESAWCNIEEPEWNIYDWEYRIKPEQEKEKIDTPENFLANGYRETKLAEYQMKDSDRFFQKKITDSVGIRYFINVYYYDWTKYSNRHADFGYSSSVQFQNPTDMPTIDVSIGSSNIEEIEKTFTKLWNNIGRPYYEEF